MLKDVKVIIRWLKPFWYLCLANQSIGYCYALTVAIWTSLMGQNELLERQRDREEKREEKEKEKRGKKLKKVFLSFSFFFKTFLSVYFVCLLWIFHELIPLLSSQESGVLIETAFFLRIREDEKKMKRWEERKEKGKKEKKLNLILAKN